MGDLLALDASVVSGITIEDLKAGRITKLGKSDTDIPGEKTPFPGKIAPMLAEHADAPFTNPDWVFEPKLDGYRIIATVREGTATLHSRRGLDVSAAYKNIVNGLKALPISEAIFDGELIALDAGGKPDFQILQEYLESTWKRKSATSVKAAPLIYYVFDILYLDGHDLTSLPLTERKNVLKRTLRPSVGIRLLDYFEGNGEQIFKSSIDAGFEGVMAKQKSSRYYPGERSRGWLKIKSMMTDDFVVGGYSPGAGTRSGTFGSLAVGYYDDNGRLIPAGNVGTGFDERTLHGLKQRFSKLKTDKMPFAVEPAVSDGLVWVKPEMVIEVKFSEWTRDGQLRIPVFLCVRTDKTPEEVKHSVVPPVIIDPKPSPFARRRPMDAPENVLKQLDNTEDSLTLDVENRRLKLTNLNKVLWPASGDVQAVTKREYITYLASVSQVMLKHLKDRPLTLSRYPNGIDGQHFFQKHWLEALPDFVETVRLSGKDQTSDQYLLCNNFITLLWLGQVADLEFHSWFSRVTPGQDMEKQVAESDIDTISNYPDFIIFDIDPYVYSGNEKQGDEPELNRVGFEQACQVALWLKTALDSLSFSAFIKTSGKTGLHIHVPIIRQLTFHQVQSAAGTICESIRQAHPDTITTDWVVKRRTGKVFLDFNQNVRGKTLASVYSPRPAIGAPVSTPLTWDEVRSGVYPSDFTIRNVPARLTEKGDLWAGILNSQSDIKKTLHIE